MEYFNNQLFLDYLKSKGNLILCWRKANIADTHLAFAGKELVSPIVKRAILSLQRQAFFFYKSEYNLISMAFGRKFIIFFLLFIIILHSLAMYFFLYWRVWWFDMLMHFLGGSLAGFFVLHIFKSGLNRSFWFSLFVVVAGSASIGIFWEFFEFFLGNIFPGNLYFGFEQLGVTDTLSDLFFDLAGGSIAGITALKFIRFKREELKNYGKD